MATYLQNIRGQLKFLSSKTTWRHAPEPLTCDVFLTNKTRLHRDIKDQCFTPNKTLSEGTLNEQER